MTDLPLDGELLLLPQQGEATVWNRAQSENGDWSFSSTVMRRDEVDRSGVLVDLAGPRADVGLVFPLMRDHGIKGDKTRYGWAYYRADDDRGWFEGTLPDTQRTRDFIEEVEHDERYGKASSSVGLRYNRSLLRQPTAEQRARGARVYMPGSRIKDISYTNVPRLTSATFDLLRSFDAEGELDSAEAAIQMATADAPYVPSAALQEVFKRWALKGDSG